MHAEFQAEEFTDPTLVVRRWMLGVQLPTSIQEQADAIVASCESDKWKLVNSFCDASEEILGNEDYLTRLAWDIYRFKACEEFGALILPVEDYLEDTYWNGIRQRASAAHKVKLKQVSSDAFVANGSSGEYMVNTLRVTCTCPDFVNRGRKNGMHCKHLIAALRQNGMWEESWGAEIPKSKRSIQTVSA